jgi:phage terminase large subunit
MGRTLQIQTPYAFLPLLQPKRYKGLYGGRGSGKSHAFAELMIDKHLEPGQRSVCIREYQKSLDQSSKQLLEDKLKQFGLGRQDGFAVMDTEIRTPGDGLIIFQGMQNHNADSIKSLEGYDRAWVEEGQSLSARSLELLTPTIRKDYPDGTQAEIWVGWNPQDPNDPVDKLLRGKHRHPDSIVIGTTYRDNPWFPNTLRKDMEWDRQTDPEKYARIWLGEYERHSEARVFRNFRVEAFDTPPNTIFNTGADWGFAVDPSTLVRTFTQTHNPATGAEWPRKRLYIDYDISAVGVEIDHLPSFFDGLVCGCRNRTVFVEGAPLIVPATCVNPTQHGVMRPWPIIADSARPETISYMRRHGYARMESARKGPNSIKEGVIFLQGYEIIIHPRCETTVDEFTNYSYQQDPHTRVITPLLEDKKNHIIDPVRYAAEQLRHVLVVRETQWG